MKRSGLTELAVATQAYELCVEAEIAVRLVEFPEATELIGLRPHFPRAVDQFNPTPVERIGQHVRRAIWKINTSVSRMNDLRLDETAERLQSALRDAAFASGSRIEAASEEAIRVLSELSTQDHSPLGQAVLEAIDEHQAGSRVLVVPDEESWRLAKEWCSSQDVEFEVVRRSDVQTAFGSEHLLIVGSVTWYTEALTTAPLGRLTEFIHYSWLSVPKASGGLLPSDSVGVARELIVTGKPTTTPYIDPSDLPPSPNWGAFRALSRDHAREGDDEDIEVRAVLLSGDHGALVRDGDGHEVVVAIPREEGVDVTRVPTRGLEPGMYIPFRTSGSDGDFLRDLANRKFGALRYRDQTEEWKAALRRKMLERGNALVKKDLRSAGARTANVRYWSSPDSIRPRSDQDFTVLLRYLGFDEETPQLILAADEILRAHHKAGHHVRKLLVEQMSDTDFDSLHGVIEIELDDGDGGQLSVHRLLRIADETFVAPSSSVMKPFPLEENAWLA